MFCNRSTKHLLKALCIMSLSLLTALVLAWQAPAQDISPTEQLPGGIAGTVLDPNGDPVPGASVILQGPTPHDSYSGHVSDNGFFELRNVRSGMTFRVTIHAHGFADWTSTPIVLGAGQYKLLTDCTLQLEEVHTTVNVSYSSVQVATEQVAAQEKQRILGVFPNFYVNYDPDPAPMTAKLKFKLALRVAVDPALFSVQASSPASIRRVTPRTTNRARRAMASGLAP